MSNVAMDTITAIIKSIKKMKKRMISIPRSRNDGIVL